jgi:phosphoglycerate dehydrogenase-like enzyme/DNA-binding transcriptional ArsR family regulator
MDDEHEEVLWAQLGPDGIVLMPSVFNWPLVSSRLATSSQTTLLYPARGVATVWQALSAQRAGQFAAAEELIGATRARLLDTLRSPATTSALAQRFGVTPGAVSQHLGVLYRARLLTRQRSGAAVLYQASDLGLALLGAAVASTGGSAVPPHRGHDNRVMLNGKGDDVAAPGNLVIAVVGASPPEVPLPAGMPAGLEGCEFRFITAPERLAADAPDADVAFVWQPRLDWIENHWGWSPRLRWIAAASAGVDYLMFPELVGSDVTVTNSAGIFDDAMAEYALALIGAVCADLPATLRLQAKREWLHRETRRLAGREVLVLGAGGIGRATTRLLRAAGTRVTCLARTRRADPELGEIAALGELPGLLPGADFVVLALPHTPSTDKIIGAAELALMSPGAWLVNLGRGALVDEPALITALQAGAPGGAALDVFAAEPLAADSPLWGLPNVIVSPHMSGDARGWDRALTDLFLAQLARYRAGRPLENVVDKSLGFVPRAAR